MINKVFTSIWLILTLLCLLTPVKAQENVMNLYSYEAEVKVKSNGKGIFSINLRSAFTEPLNWNIGVKDAQKIQIQGDGQKIEKFSKHKEDGFLRLSTKKEYATNWVIDFESSDPILINDRDNFKWQAITGKHGYIYFVSINLQSDIKFIEKNRISHRIYAFHGVGDYDTGFLSEKAIYYKGSNLGESAGFSIFASWPKNSLNLSSTNRLKLAASQFSIIHWVIFALLVPLGAAVGLIAIFLKTRKYKLKANVNEIIDRPPSDSSPLEVGILMENTISAKSLMAATLDLCQKGYIIIIRSENQYSFGKRKTPDENLKEWEKLLFEEITLNNKVWTREKELQKITSKELFSPKIKKIFDMVNDYMTEKGYFTENPQIIEFTYKLYGILLYLLAVIGLAWVAFKVESSYLLIPLIGVLGASLVIIRLAHLMPVQGKDGVEARINWLKFKNYLKDENPIESTDAISGLFTEFLPYAMIFGVEKAWLNRFRMSTLPAPDWYLKRDAIDEESQKLTQEIVNEVCKIALRLNQLKGPNVR